MRNKSIFSLVLFLALALPFFTFPVFSQNTESITITTYYPAPYGVYQNLRLFPTTTIPECTTENHEGVMYYDATNNQAMVCVEDPVGTFDWQGAGLWRRNESRVFLPNTDWKVGIGTIGPDAKLDITVNQANDGIRLNAVNAAGGSDWVDLLIALGNGSWNGMSVNGDRGIIWGSSLGIDNPRGGFVIAPWRADTSGIRVDANGNVGIGASSLGQPLRVSSDTDAYLGQLLVDGRSTHDAVIGLATTTGNTDAAIYLDKSDSDKLKIALGNTDLKANRDAATKMTIMQDGNVGIGTTTPVAKLEVATDIAGIGNMGFGRSWGDLWYDGGNDSYFTIGNFGASTGATAFCWWNTSVSPATFRVLMTINNDGTVQVPGTFDATTVSANVKNFKINHPTKPGKQLVHSTLEGPEAAVFYRGQAKLVNGTATIDLPDYFEKLTLKDGRTIQLTAKGKEPFLLSSTDINSGKFSVYGTKVDGVFFWEVKAVRSDVGPLQVEVKE